MSDHFEEPATSSPVIIIFAENCLRTNLTLRAKFINGLEEQFGPLRAGTKWKDSGVVHVYPSFKSKKEELLSTFKLFGCDISCREPQGALFAKGVIRAPTIYSEEEIKEELRAQGVTHVRRFYKGEEPNKIPQLIVNLTFDSPVLPDEVRLAQQIFPVQRFVPRPDQCWNCWVYGAEHRSDKCPEKKICKRCAQHHPGYDHSTCKNKPCCPNCKKGDHVAGSTSCRVQRDRQESLRISRLNDLTPAEAGNLLRQRAKQADPPPRLQFAPVQPSTAQASSSQTSNQEIDTLYKRVTALEKEVTTLKTTVAPIPGQVTLLQQEVGNLQSSTNALTIECRSGFDEMKKMFGDVMIHLGMNKTPPPSTFTIAPLPTPAIVNQRPAIVNQRPATHPPPGPVVPPGVPPGKPSSRTQTGNGKPTAPPINTVVQEK